MERNFEWVTKSVEKETSLKKRMGSSLVFFISNLSMKPDYNLQSNILVHYEL